MSGLVKSKAKYVLVLATAFFVYQLYLLLNSLPVSFRLYSGYLAQAQGGAPFWVSFWIFSEFIGEIGLVLRFAGAGCFIGFAWVLFRRRAVVFSLLRKAVLLEGVHFLFYAPFVAKLFLEPVADAAVKAVYVETAFSYSVQLVLVFSSLFVFYWKMRHESDSGVLLKWGAVGVVCYVFALWVKHFMLCVYALPVSFGDVALVVGFLNSAVTMLAAALVLLFAFAPLIRGKSGGFNVRLAGYGFVLMGTYFVVYVLVSLVNGSYLSFLSLTELWAVAFAVVGAGLLKGNNDVDRGCGKRKLISVVTKAN